MRSVLLWCSQDYCTFYPDGKCHIVVFTGLLYFLSWWQVSYCGVHMITVLFILMKSVILWCSHDYWTFLSWWKVSYCGVHRTIALCILMASVILWCSEDSCTFYLDCKCHIVVFTGLLYFLSWWQVSYCGVHRTTVFFILMASVILWCPQDYCTFYPNGKCHIVVFTWLLYFLSWWQVSYCGVYFLSWWQVSYRGVHRTNVFFILMASVILWCSQDYYTFYPNGKCHIVVFTETIVLFILMTSVILWCSQDYWTCYPDCKCPIVVFTGLLYFLSWWKVSYCSVHRITVLFILMASVILWCSQRLLYFLSWW